MTLEECIAEIDEIEPNAYSEEQKIKWVMQVEKSVATGIYLINAEDVGFPELAESSPDYGFPLLVPSPFDKIYPLYLHAMIHYANSEYERYQNDMQLYNAAYGEFARWFAAKYEPALTVDREALDFRITLEPGETTNGDVELAHVRGVVSPLRIEADESLSGHAYVHTEATSLLEWEGSYYIRYGHMAYYEPNASVRVTYELANYSDEPQALHISGHSYRYGWPDKYGRRQ